MSFRHLVVAALVGALCTVGAAGVLAGNKKAASAGTFFANATGENEISPTTGKRGAGDKDGRAGFTAVIDGNQFCWGIAAKNVDGTPSGAHIHKGDRNENGPVVIPLDPPANADPGASSGCEPISADLANAITKNPNQYYFNLHSTPDFPAGAVRGQLRLKR